jgi:arylsulfatase A-like enzyme
MIQRLKIVGILVIALLLLSRCTGVSKGEVKKPNILFLFTDDQRYGTIGELHHDAVKTPNIDKLVDGGVTFTNAYIFGAPHGAVCSPSRAMLMTGRFYYNISPNVYAQFSVPQSEKGVCDLLTFPEYFKANGYKTFATGKQHNGQQWIERGFDEAKSVYLGGMTKHFGTLVKDFFPNTGWSNPYADRDKFSSELFADAAIDFMENHRDEKPFLMYVAFTAPHDPRTAPQAFHEMYPPEEIELPPNFKKEHPFRIADMKIRDEKLAAFPREPEEIKKHISDYYAMITATDVQIGRILDELEKSGEAKNTIIVFSGDNGLAVGQHGLMGKQNVYEHSIKVPLIFCGPGIPKDVKTEAFAYLHDVFPTLCGLTGLEIPESVETKNLAPVILGKQAEVREVMHFGYSSWPGDILREKEGEESDRGAHRAVRKGDWKLIISSKEGVVTRQLFNLKEDPWELNNVADAPELYGPKQELLSELKRLMKETGDPADLEKDEFGLFDDPGEHNK